MPPEPAPAGGLEAEVLSILATSARSMTPAEVREALDRELAYTTVMTTLVRLFEKQALVRRRRGRAYAYQLNGGSDGARASMTAHQMQKLLADGNRQSVLLRFVDGLDDESVQLLRELMDRHREDERP